jgi:hypothetical protein
MRYSLTLRVAHTEFIIDVSLRFIVHFLQKSKIQETNCFFEFFARDDRFDMLSRNGLNQLNLYTAQHPSRRQILIKLFELPLMLRRFKKPVFYLVYVV